MGFLRRTSVTASAARERLDAGAILVDVRSASEWRSEHAPVARHIPLDQLAQIPGEKIFSVQINDAPAQPKADLWEELMTGRLLPGEGDLDLIGLIRTLDAIGAQIPIAVEVFSEKLNAQPLADSVRAMAQTGAAIIRQARTAS